MSKKHRQRQRYYLEVKRAVKFISNALEREGLNKSDEATLKALATLVMQVGGDTSMIVRYLKIRKIQGGMDHDDVVAKYG